MLRSAPPDFQPALLMLRSQALNVWLNNALWVTASAVVVIEEAIKQKREFVCDSL